MHWGHEVLVGRNEKQQVTREEYNEMWGAAHETPDEPILPEVAYRAWQWFFELCARRCSGFDSLQPLQYTEIAAWLALSGRLITHLELHLILAMDSAWLVAVAEEKEAKRERDSKNGN